MEAALQPPSLLSSHLSTKYLDTGFLYWSIHSERILGAMDSN